MARPLRIEYPGAFYHVLNRGLEQHEIFLDKKDYARFLDLIEEIHKKYQIRLHSYCLMPNHYHLYIETPEGNLGKAMRHLDGVYTQRFNRRYERTGPLFQGRYKAILVEKESYSLEISRYIHLNPVKAKLVERPDEWEWSSYSIFMGSALPKRFLETNWLLGQFSSNKNEARRLFHQFTMEGLKEVWEPAVAAKGGYLLGRENFYSWIREEFLKEKEDKEIPTLQRLRKPMGVDEMREIIARITDDLSWQRKLWSYALWNYSSLSLKEIAQKVGGVSPYGVSKLVQRLKVVAEEDHKVKRLIIQLDVLFLGSSLDIGQLSNVQT